MVKLSLVPDGTSPAQPTPTNFDNAKSRPSSVKGSLNREDSDQNNHAWDLCNSLSKDEEGEGETYQLPLY